MGTFPAACREGCLCLSLLVPHRLRRGDSLFLFIYNPFNVLQAIADFYNKKHPTKSDVFPYRKNCFPKNYRFFHCGALLAFLSPGFFLSTSRGSRVR